jgi:hypothetical protein
MEKSAEFLALIQMIEDAEAGNVCSGCAWKSGDVCRTCIKNQ